MELHYVEGGGGGGGRREGRLNEGREWGTERGKRKRRGKIIRLKGVEGRRRREVERRGMDE